MMNARAFPFLLLLLSSLILAACNAAGGFEPTARQSAMTTEQAVVKALTDYLEGQGAPVSQMSLDVRAIADDYARVEVVSTDPAEPGGFNAFMRLENGAWTTVVSGSGMEKEHVEALGIPQSVWPESWLSQASQPEIQPQPTTSPSKDDCPTATVEAQTQSLVDEVRGFCLLYPASHTVEQLDSGNTEIVLGSVMNHTAPRASIVTEELAGRNLEQVVEEFLADYEGFDIERTPLTVDGEAAIQLDRIPGQDFYRKVMVAHDGTLYQLSFLPYDPSLVDTFVQAEQIYHMVIDSFRFLSPGQEPAAGSPPTAPAETEGSAVLPVPATTYRDESYGFEFDYPAAWTVSDLGVIGSRASATQFLEGERIAMQLTRYLWDPQDDLSAYVDHRQSAWSASDNTIVSQEEWNLDDNHPAASFTIQTQAGDQALFFFTTAGDGYLELAGEGDTSLLSQIAHTVRFNEPNLGSQAMGKSTPICPDLPRPAMVFQADNGQDYVLRHAASKSECTVQFDPPISRLLLLAADGVYYSTPAIGEESTTQRIVHYANDGTLMELPFLDADSVRSVVISPSGSRVVWSEVRMARTTEDEEMVVSDLYTAGADGSDMRLLHSVDNAAEVERGEPYIAWTIQPLRFVGDSDLLFTIGPDGRGGSWNASTGRYSDLYRASISSGENDLIYECPADDYFSFCIGAISADGAYFAVTNREANEIALFSMDGTPAGTYSGPGQDYTGFPTFGPAGDLVFMTADVAEDQITIEQAYLSLVAKPYETAATTLLREPLSYIWDWVDAQHILYTAVEDGQTVSFSPSLVSSDGAVERLPKTYGLFQGVLH
jgi:hypothetical protein